MLTPQRTADEVKDEREGMDLDTLYMENWPLPAMRDIGDDSVLTVKYFINAAEIYKQLPSRYKSRLPRCSCFPT
jgi:hypothetical protein